MFADEILAINEIARKLNMEKNITYFCNLDNRIGLPKIRKDSNNILFELKKKGLIIDEIIGGLDEYAITKNKILSLINDKYNNFDLVFIVGVPHIVSYDQIYNVNNFRNYTLISITNGPRQVLPLKKMGHHYVIVELDLHPKTLGTKKIIDSEFGSTIRRISEIIN